MEMLAATMEAIPTRIFGEGVTQKRALEAARYDHLAVFLEILAGGFLIPHGGTLRQHRQMRMQALVDHMAGNAARMALPLGKKDRLHFRPEELEIQDRRGRVRGGCGGRRRWRGLRLRNRLMAHQPEQ